MKCIIVDNEPGARETLAACIETYCLELSLVGVADHVSEAAGLIEELRPDLIFLDIQMPDGNGFQLINRLPNYNYALIFTTTYDQYALRAIKLGALDYLLKPIDWVELQEAVVKAKRHIELTGNMRLLKTLQTDQEGPEKMVISTIEGYYVLQTDEIISLSADRNYTRIAMRNDRHITASKTLKYFSELLPPNRFYRIHKSHIVNLNEIVRVSRGQAGFVEMSDGMELDISKNRKTQLLKQLRLQIGW